ncbi:MAG: maltose alpha-D-glucosyltransferase [Candidatus Brocadiae bacterium]|nr:maltose alpha-D-glucosyltransferase [Candidatus Brocadiia bacterium]
MAPPAAIPWYQDLVIYEVYVRGFYDADGNGTGDLRGLTERLDYIRGLGVGAIWLLPIFPSPRKDDGYDVSDFRGIHPDIGTLDDFRILLEKAHEAGLRVLVDLVLNHTSDQHPWFQSARRGPGHPHHDWYVWSPTPAPHPDVRVIFSDTESSNWTLDPACGLYFWHRFYAHQPDLNYDNPEVRAAMLDIARYWLDLGVDGFRIDAAPYLFEREGTLCEGLPETHAFLRALRGVCDTFSPPRILLAEANQSPEELAAYFGQGDEVHMAFDFPLMPRLFLALRREDARPIIDILRRQPVLPAGCQWAMFLRNHDELTLEKIDPDDRQFMWDEYAGLPGARFNLGIRRRLWPLLSGGRRQIELLHALILSIPGCAVLYYGDEIGMGDDVRLGDRMGVRTPMQWTTGPNAGFSTADAADLYAPVITDPEYHFAGHNVQSLERKPSSVVNWLRRVLITHRANPGFRGAPMRILDVENPAIFAFVRENAAGTVLCVNNLSQFMQPALIPSGNWKGLTPVDLIGGAALPPVSEEHTLLTLGPHSFYWLRLDSR